MTLRMWWEDVYHMPSLGNPLFEDRSEVEWIEMLLAKHFASGGGARLEDNGLIVRTKKDEEDGSADPQYTGDEVDDRIERRLALGLDVEEDGDDG